MIVQSRRQFVRTLAFSAGAVMVAPAASAQDDDGLPNTFISPCGKPFRAARGAPYPVIDWFKQADKNGDGKLDHGEFMADTEAFFKVLDLRNTGYLDDYDIAVYEHRIAPEILGLQASLDGYGPAPRIWLAQAPSGGEAEDSDSEPKAPKDLDESKVGAAPFGFFNSPEPVTAADTQFRGVVTKADFMALGERHFTALDSENAGYLTLAKLPKTAMQLALEHTRRGRL
jgi:hypothetical protein